MKMNKAFSMFQTEVTHVMLLERREREICSGNMEALRSQWNVMHGLLARVKLENGERNKSQT